jgi:hypothetical protein
MCSSDLLVQKKTICEIGNFAPREAPRETHNLVTPEKPPPAIDVLSLLSLSTVSVAEEKRINSLIKSGGKNVLSRFNSEDITSLGSILTVAADSWSNTAQRLSMTLGAILRQQFPEGNVKSFGQLLTFRGGDSVASLILTLQKACAQPKDAPITQATVAAWTRLLRLLEDFAGTGAFRGVGELTDTLVEATTLPYDDQSWSLIGNSFAKQLLAVSVDRLRPHAEDRPYLAINQLEPKTAEKLRLSGLYLSSEHKKFLAETYKEDLSRKRKAGAEEERSKSPKRPSPRGGKGSSSSDSKGKGSEIFSSYSQGRCSEPCPQGNRHVDCNQFNSKRGCSYGTKCKFRHVKME